MRLCLFGRPSCDRPFSLRVFAVTTTTVQAAGTPDCPVEIPTLTLALTLALTLTLTQTLTLTLTL